MWLLLRLRLTAKAFCEQQGIPLKTFYSSKHALGRLAASDNLQPITSSSFAQAKVLRTPSHIVMQTRDAQLSLPGECDPLWLAKLLKGLSA